MRGVALAAMLLAAPAQALDPASLAGLWRGDGVLSVAAQPDQRLRCELRFRASATAGRSFLLGRCATAQGGQSFHYRLDQTGPSALTATREEDAPADLPATLAGLRAGETLSLIGADVEFLLVRSGADLTFRLSAPGQDGVATATLMRRGD